MRPILQALLLCDRVYQDKSGKYIIVGVFDHWFYQLPDASSEPPREPGVEYSKSLLKIHDVGTPWTYISLTDVKGATNLELRFERLNGAEVYFSAELEVSSSDPLKSVQVGIPVPRLPSKAGDYILELLHENVSLGSYRVKITELKKDVRN